MQTVVVGGQARKIGKTSVIVSLLRGLRAFHWTAVKITQHQPDLHLPRGASSPGCEDFALTEERTDCGRGDTHRYLAAGARRALWMQVRPGSLPKAFLALLAALANDRLVMMESNRILDFLKPDLFLLVLDSRVRDFKKSARKFFPRADALISVGPLDANAWPGLDAKRFRGKRVFTVSRPDSFSPELCRFVRRTLRLPAPPSA